MSTSSLLRSRPNRWSTNGVAALLVAVAAGCSAGADPTTATSASGSGGGGGSTGEGGALLGSTTSSIASTGEGGGCDSYTKQGKRKPLHLFVLLDRSSSMDGDKWDNAVNGLTAFVGDAESAGVDFAIRTMPLPGTPTCDAFAYRDPEVGWTELPAGGPEVAAFLETAVPDGQSTPFYPALGGALLETIAKADQNPSDAAAVLVMTDGAPQGPPFTCGGVDAESIDEIAQLAQNAFANDNPVYTFVVGLRNVDLSFANAVAAAGGTDAAFPIAGNNPAASLLDALDTIRAKALPCSYEIPDDVATGDVQITEVNVEITVDGIATTIPRNDDCDGPGWRYDDLGDPQEIILCPESCDDLRSDAEGRLQIVLGCATIVN